MYPTIIILNSIIDTKHLAKLPFSMSLIISYTLWTFYIKLHYTLSYWMSRYLI